MSKTLPRFHQISQSFQQIDLAVKHEKYDMKAAQLISFLKNSIHSSWMVDQFSLNIGYCNHINLQVMRTLAFILSDFRQLTQLSLKFDPSTLDFNLQKSNSEETLLVKNQFAQFPLLNSLSISIQRSKTDDTQIDYICQLFSSQIQLKYFKLELDGSQITKSGLSSISQFIDSLEQLTQLTISISNNEGTIQKNQYLTLWESINKLKNLVELNVSITNCNLEKNSKEKDNLFTQMKSLKTLSFTLLKCKQNDNSLLIKQLLDFIRYLPNLESLTIECGDDYNIDSQFLISILEVSSKLNTLKLNTGKNIIFEDESQVQKLLKSLAIEPQSSLFVNHDYNFVQIQVKNKDDLINLDLKFLKSCKQKEQIVLRVSFLELSRYMKNLKVHFRSLQGLEDTLKICNFGGVEELHLDTISDENNIIITSLFLECVQKSKLQVFNIKFQDIHNTINESIIQNLKKQILECPALKKVYFNLRMKDLQFSLQELLTLSQNILNYDECELKISDVNIYNEETDDTLCFRTLIKKILSQKGALLIDLDSVQSKIILNNKRNISLDLPMHIVALNQFCKGMLYNLDSFQQLENCMIKQKTSSFTSILSNPIKLDQLQPNIDPSVLGVKYLIYTDLIFYMKFFSVYSCQSQSYDEDKELLFSNLKKISLNEPISDLLSMVKHMKSVESLDINIEGKIDNDMVNSLSSLKNLKSLSLCLKVRYEGFSSTPRFRNLLNESNLVRNESITSVKLLISHSQNENLINKKKMIKIFKRICKRLVSVNNKSS